MPFAHVPTAAAQSARTTNLTESISPGSVRTPWRSRNRSEHQTEWFSVRYTTNATGRVRATTNSYVEIGIGLNRTNALGQWQPSNPAFQITATGAEAGSATHRVTLAGNINTAGAVQIEKDGVKLQGHPLCVAYYDPVDGRSELLAELTDATGWLVASNIIVFSNCFDGLRASIRYRNAVDGIEQDLILHERPALTPAELGLSDRTRLELFTEWIGETPLPEQSTRLVERERDADLRKQMVEPDLTDSTLNFGVLRMPGGKAFAAGAPPVERTAASLDTVSVSKRFEIIDGRKILIEAVPYQRVRPMLDRLPTTPISGALTNAALRSRSTTNGAQLAQARPSVLPLLGAADEVSVKDKSIPAGVRADQQPQTQSAKLETRNPKLDLDAPIRLLPAKRLAQARSDRRIQTASSSNSKPEIRNAELAFVLDWQTEITGGFTDYTFFSATTYVCSASVNLYGTTRIQGGTVVRFAPLPATAVLKCFGPVVCETEPYRPAFFVSKFDATIGEIVDGNTTPATYSGALQLNAGGQLRHVRIRHANEAVRGPDLDVRHSQFSYCGTALYHDSPGYGTAPVRAGNVLFCDVGYGFGGTYYYAIASHLTVHNCWGALASDPYDRSAISYVNCLGVNVDSMGNVPYTAPSSELGAIGVVFQTVGAASHYLAPSSPHRGVGSTAIDPTLLAELKQTTTYPPQVLTGTLSANQTFAPSPLVVVRNASPGLDRGYAYDVVDYVARGLRVENSSLPVTLLATNGVVVAVEPNSSTYGIWFGQNAQFISMGSPVASNRFVMAHSIFENKPSVAWNAYDGFSTFRGASLGSSPNASLRFTDLPMISGNYYHIPADSYASFFNLALQDTTLRGGILYLVPNNPSQRLSFTNCLFENVVFNFRPYAPATLNVWNNLFKKGTLTLETAPPGNPPPAVGTWRDNLFDGTIISQQGGATTDNNYNAYVQTAQNNTRLTPAVGSPNNHDQILTASLAYESGPFGKYYLQGTPTALIDKGSRTAAAAGLYHYTTRKTVGFKDGTDPPSPYQVDLGLHFVAANSSNQPLDTDGDTLADFEEDANGNGLVDAGETDLAESDTDGDGLDDAFELRVSHTGALNPDTGNTGVSDGYKDTDNDGWTNIDEARNGTNPNTWNAPPGPRLVLSGTIKPTSVALSWEPGFVPVQQYVIERGYYYDSSACCFQSIATLGPNINQYTDTSPAGSCFECNIYRIKAVYGNGDSQWSSPVRAFHSERSFQAYVVRGQQNKLKLIASGVPSDVETIRIKRAVYTSRFPEFGWPYSLQNANEPPFCDYDGSPYLPPVSNGFFDAPLHYLTDGVYPIPDSAAPPFGSYYFETDDELVNNQATHVFPRSLDWLYEFPNYNQGNSYNPAFIDGSAHLKQNLRFFLRAASQNYPFAFHANCDEYQQPPSYVYAGYQHPHLGVDFYLSVFEPFEENYFLRNFVFNPSDTAPNGAFNSGVFTDPFGFFEPPLRPTSTVTNARYRFDTYGYVSGGGIGSIPTLLPTSGTYSTFSHRETWPLDPQDNPELGLTLVPSGNKCTISFASNVRNLYGLRQTGVRITAVNSTPNSYYIPAGGQVSNVPYPIFGSRFYEFYTECEEPVLETVGYYFARVEEQIWDTLYTDAIPGHSDFQTTMTTPLLVTSLGKRLNLSAWAKQRIVNGYQNKFAYLGQYFDKAYKADGSGNATSTQTGILSEYGEFFPTEPGLAVLKTKYDTDQAASPGGPQGEARVHVLKIQFDVNHDGNMDLTFAGPDNTTADRPFTFWLNNDVDRGHFVDCIPGPCDWEEDDLKPDEILKLPEAERVPDCSFKSAGFEVIPCKRDLEDYARLWLPGFSQLMAALPASYDVELFFRNPGNAGNPTLRVFRAAESSGGTGYLTDEVVANNQIINPFEGRYFGTIGPNQSLSLSGLYRTLPPVFGQPNDHFIFCGIGRGTGELVLQVRDGQTVIGETSAFIQMRDIKEMYERWTVGDAGSVEPFSTARLASEGLLPPANAFQYAYSVNSDANTPYLLHVHGWNMTRWEKDAYAETMFKRLYWQGYQGRFGSFRWPTFSKWPSVAGEGGLFNHYDRSEWQAWKSGVPLRNLLTRLNTMYPGQVRLSAHSMGNIVAGEALRIPPGNPPLVQVYAAMQSAVPAHSYDPTRPARTIVFDSGTPNVFAQYWTAGSPCYFNGVVGAAAYVNFFNPVDLALDAWTTDQDLKPDGSIGYLYHAPSSGLPQFEKPTLPNPRVLTFPNDAHEIFSFIIEGRCFALGAQASVGGVFDPQFEVLLDPDFEFGNKHPGHSAQFRSTNMKRALFWARFMRRLGL